MKRHPMPVAPRLDLAAGRSGARAEARLARDRPGAAPANLALRHRGATGAPLDRPAPAPAVDRDDTRRSGAW